MTLLPNYLAGRWQVGAGGGTPLIDPVLGSEVARIGAASLDLAQAFAFAREKGGSALRSLSYGQRAAMLDSVAKVLQANRDAYYEIATANSGTTRRDSGIDIDGAIFTVGQYAKWGAALGDVRALLDGAPARLGKDPAFQARHVLVPARGVALLINAFNFPAWGLWEKAAPALLSGVPVIVKPASATAWLAQKMVADVIAAAILPEGALSILCGRSEGLLDQLQGMDMVSFTGSAETAAAIRAHPAVAQRSARANVEADSLNAARLAPDAAPGSESFALLVDEAVREITVKSGQKCTAIRRILVPRSCYEAAAEAIAAKLRGIVVGNPRNEAVRMGALVNRAQLAHVQDGVRQLRAEATLIHDGAAHALTDADPAVACCVGPTLLGMRAPEQGRLVHEVEVFGPVATLMAYDGQEAALSLIRRGGGSLVVSLYSEDARWIADTALALADSHGRVHAISPDIAKSHTGHGNVMPISLHGGPGRAGGGEELGGLRALAFYHRRCAVQAATASLDLLAAAGACFAP